MPPDPTHTLTDAILAVTPLTPEGRVYVGHHTRGRTRYMDYGDPRPVAARQAAAARPAVYRELAALIDAGLKDPRDPHVTILAITPRQLRDLADQIDTNTQETRTEGADGG